jgi:hypothetical protein
MMQQEQLFMVEDDKDLQESLPFRSNEFVMCPWCGQASRLEFVRGHYQCNSCKRPVWDCCDGEKA